MTIEKNGKIYYVIKLHTVKILKNVFILLDLTARFIESYIKPPKITTQTTITEIISLFKHSFANKIPFDPFYKKEIATEVILSEEFAKYIEFTSHNIISARIFNLFSMAIYRTFTPGAGEFSLIYYLDLLVKDPMELLSNLTGIGLKFGRNVTIT